MQDQYFNDPMSEADPSDNLTRSFEFGNNGTKLYTCGYGTDVINQYTLSTAYKVDTATRDGGYDMTGDGAATPEGLRWKFQMVQSSSLQIVDHQQELLNIVLVMLGMLLPEQ